MLRYAVLDSNVLSSTILDSIASYNHLQDLVIYDRHPAACLWSNVTLPLVSLRWELPSSSGTGNSWTLFSLILRAVVDTCPELKSLNVSYHQWNLCHPVPSETVPQYPSLLASEKRLHNLQHLGLRGDFQGPSDDIHDNFDADLLSFLENHNNTLISLTLPIDKDWAVWRLGFTLETCRRLPKLKCLILDTDRLHVSTRFPRALHLPIWRPLRPLLASEYLGQLTSGLAKWNPLLEKFSMTSIGYTFHPSMARLFKPLQSLKFLRLGDSDNEGGPFDSERRIDFHAYKPVSTMQPVSEPSSSGS